MKIPALLGSEKLKGERKLYIVLTKRGKLGELEVSY